MKDEKFYKPLETYLDDVNKTCVAMEHEDRKYRVGLAILVSMRIIEAMREMNQVFKTMFHKLTYVGSYFDGLRVKEATEFDLNVVLKLPICYDDLKIVRHPGEPGFVKIGINEAKYTGLKKALPEVVVRELKKWSDQNGFISHYKVLRWWEGMFSHFVEQGHASMVIENIAYKVEFRKAWPAMTARITGAKIVVIDIDLAPAFEFTHAVVPPQPIKFTSQNLPWYVVPKRREDNDFLWRISFPVHEKQLIQGKYHLKFVNRFLKRVRDSLKWKPLASYYIKTVFLWEAHTQKEQHFFNKNLGYLFMYFLEKLQSYLEKTNLPFFWDKEYNLLQKLHPSTMHLYASYIKKSRSQLERFIEEKNWVDLRKKMDVLFHEGALLDHSVRVLRKMPDFANDRQLQQSKRAHLTILQVERLKLTSTGNQQVQLHATRKTKEPISKQEHFSHFSLNL